MSFAYSVISAAHQIENGLKRLVRTFEAAPYQVQFRQAVARLGLDAPDAKLAAQLQRLIDVISLKVDRTFGL